MSGSRTSVRKGSTAKRKNTELGALPSIIKKKKVEFTSVFEDNKVANENFTPADVYAFGSGDTGQLGLGEDIMEKKRPQKVEELENIIKIRCGGMHSLCLDTDGVLYSFGCNDEGALGRKCKDDSESSKPDKVIFPKDVQIKDISAGDSHSVALSSDGRLYVWGAFRDYNGVIGLIEANVKVAEPVEVFVDKPVVKVASGDNHVALLLEDGSISTFGVAENGQLGRVSDRHLVKGGRAGLESILKPDRVRTRHNVRYCDVWAGSYCTIGRATNGAVYGCGLNNYKQLINTDELSILMMTPLTEFNQLNEAFRYFGFGQHHTIALTESNRVFVVGRGEYGSLGLGNTENCATPSEVKLPNDNIMCVYTCNRSSYALLRDGTCYSWGAADTYMLAHGDDEDVCEPRLMQGKQLTDKAVIEISPGAQHVILRVIKKSDVSSVIATAAITTTNTVLEKVAEEIPEVSASPDDGDNKGGQNIEGATENEERMETEGNNMPEEVIGQQTNNNFKDSDINVDTVTTTAVEN